MIFSSTIATIAFADGLFPNNALCVDSIVESTESNIFSNSANSINNSCIE